MKIPRAVLISDIHFTVSTLELASNALQQALDKAKELDRPLVIAGDLLDSKAIIRGECANRLVKILSAPRDIRVLIIPGNHDMINERGTEHSLNFLKNICEIVDFLVYDDQVQAWLIPYHSDPQEMINTLKLVTNTHPIIMHQGVSGAEMGHYSIDKTSLPKEVFKKFRIISGHYHKAQDIICNKPTKLLNGVFTYIGSPYSISYAEAEDGPKGFRVLYDDNSLDFISTNLRKHIIVNLTLPISKMPSLSNINSNDLVWVKVSASQGDLDKLDRKELVSIIGNDSFRLDKIPTDSQKMQDTVNLTDQEILDKVIDSTSDSLEYKNNLKGLWREIIKS